VSVALFSCGDHVLASGQASNFKIDCDALSDADISCIAMLIAERVPRFGVVESVPRGGDRLAAALRPYAARGEQLLIVDDVWTTGRSMRAHRGDRDARGAVIFARERPPDWVFPLLIFDPTSMNARFAS
jgi:orotate phosphoribosyltransferase